MIKQNSIGIMGAGMVGGAVKSFFSSAVIYSPSKQLDSIAKVAESQFVFICVPTPYREGLDLSMMDDAIENVVKHLIDKDNQLIVIKSTAWPGVTQKYQDKYPEVNFAFNPEFLRDRTASEDFAHPDQQIIGFTTKTKDHPLVKSLMEILPQSPYQSFMPSETAELVKYGDNSFLALRVIFANQIYDVCQVLGIDYDEVKEAVKADKRIGTSHWEIMHTEESLKQNKSKPYRGYGGKCYPKDVSTLIFEGNKLGIDVSLFERAREVNFKLNGGEFDE